MGLDDGKGNTKKLHSIGGYMTQHKAILAHLGQGKPLTPVQAYEVAGTTKLSTRIGELRRQGYPIKDRWVHIKNRYGHNAKFKEYYMEAE